MNEEFKQLWSQSPPPNWFDMTEMQKYEYFFLAGQASQKKKDAEIAKEQMEREAYGHAKHACQMIVEAIEGGGE